MTYTITDLFGNDIRVKPRVELYSVRDFMHTELPGLAIVLDEVDADSNPIDEYAVLTVSFGEFIGLKNSAYIDVNNCPFAEQLLKQGIAEATPFSKESGFCSYPLWVFKEDFLKEHGGSNYQQYTTACDEYMEYINSMFGGPEENEENELTLGGM